MLDRSLFSFERIAKGSTLLAAATNVDLEKHRNLSPGFAAIQIRAERWGPGGVSGPGKGNNPAMVVGRHHLMVENAGFARATAWLRPVQ